jgi:acyl carrier protein
MSKSLAREIIEQKCWRHCQEQFAIDPKAYSETADFFADFLSDRLDHDEMMDWVLEIFGVDTTDDEMYAVKIFRDLVDLIDRKLREP